MNEPAYKPEIVILEIRNEIKDFLDATEARDLPTIDMDSLLECVLGSFHEPTNPKEDLSTLGLVASNLAYGEGLLSGPMEGVGYSMQQRHQIFTAIIDFGQALRFRLMDLALVNERGEFSHRFKEIERDRTLRLEENTDAPGSGNRHPIPAAPYPVTPAAPVPVDFTYRAFDPPL